MWARASISKRAPTLLVWPAPAWLCHAQGPATRDVIIAELRQHRPAEALRDAEQALAATPEDARL